MSNIVIREAVAGDARKLIALRQAVYRETDRMLHEPAEYRASVWRERKYIKAFTVPENSLLLVAADGAHLVGYLGAMGGGLSKNRHAAQVMLAIRESHWRQGLARRLLDDLKIWAAGESPVTRLSLTVSVNNERALGIYEQAGFSVEGRLRRMYKSASGEYNDELAMALLL